MGKHINFEVENFDVIGENPDSQFATAKVRAFSSGENRHSMTCEESVLQATAPSIFNKPILYSFSKLFQDFGTHTEPGEALIAGFVVPDSAEFERLPEGVPGTSRYGPPSPGRESYIEKMSKVAIPEKTAQVRPVETQQSTNTYIIKSGDSLSKIAKGLNVSVQELMKANNISDPNKSRAGSSLKIPSR